MVELVDTLAWGASGASRACSSQVLRNKDYRFSGDPFFMPECLYASLRNIFTAIFFTSISRYWRLFDLLELFNLFDLSAWKEIKKIV